MNRRLQNLATFLIALIITTGIIMEFVRVTHAADAGPAPTAAPTAAPVVSDAPAPGIPEDIPPPPPMDLPGGRPSAVLLLAFVLNRLLWGLRKFGGAFFPEKLHPYTPLIAAALGLAYAVVESVTQGTPWTWAILTGLAGSAGAIAWREGTRAMGHAKRQDPPKSKPPGAMSDDELAGAAGRPS